MDYSPLIIVSALFVTLAYLLSRTFRDQFPFIPGPKGNWFFGNLFEIIDANHKKKLNVLLQEIADKYGRIYKLDMLINQFVVISDPDATKQILTDQSKFTRGADLRNCVADIMPNALFALPGGDRWKIHRKVSQPGFGPVHIEKASKVTNEIMNSLIDHLYRSIKVNELHLVSETRQITINIHDIMTSVALDIM
jgi:cytochrome P450